jgi:hypothetical protein
MKLAAMLSMKGEIHVLSPPGRFAGEFPPLAFDVEKAREA